MVKSIYTLSETSKKRKKSARYFPVIAIVALLAIVVSLSAVTIKAAASPKVSVAYIKNIELFSTDGGVRVRVHTGSKIPFTHQIERAKNGKPYRIILDCQDADHYLGAKKFSELPSTVIARIRTSQYSVTPQHVMRVVLDLKKEAFYRVEQSNNYIDLFITDRSARRFSTWSSAEFVRAQKKASIEKQSPVTIKPTVIVAKTETAPANKVIPSKTVASVSVKKTKSDQSSIVKAKTIASKTDSKKSTVSVSAPVLAVSAPIKSASVSKPVKQEKKPVAKTVAKLVTKPVAKLDAKEIAKSVTPPAKNTAKNSEKIAVKNTVKSPVKSTAKTVNKVEKTKTLAKTPAQTSPVVIAKVTPAPAKKATSSAPAKTVIKKADKKAIKKISKQMEKQTELAVAQKSTVNSPLVKKVKKTKKQSVKSTPVKKSTDGVLAKTVVKKTAIKKADIKADKKAVKKAVKKISKQVEKQTELAVAQKSTVKSTPVKKVKKSKKQSAKQEKTSKAKNSVSLFATTANAATTAEAASFKQDDKGYSATFRRKAVARRRAKLKGTQVAEFPKRLTIQYKSHGTRDPFNSLFADDNANDNGMIMGLPNVEALEMVGTLKDVKGRTRGLFEDIDGRGYILSKGDKVRNGSVLKVTETKAYFQIFEYGWSRTVALSLKG